MNNDLSNVVNIYRIRGVVIVMPWILPNYLNDLHALHYHGQLVSVEDCLYRNKGSTKWLGFYDLDEFLVPLNQPTITSLLRNIYRHDASGYCIQMVLFPKDDVFTLKDFKNGSLLVTQQFVFRTNNVFPKTRRSKCIVDPQKVFEMGIHYINKPTYAYYIETWVNTSHALVFHYRQCVGFPDLTEACKSLKEDCLMLKYKSKLIQRVNHMLKIIT